MDFLYDTISKMNKSEKLFFRRNFSSEKEPPHFLKIYDLIISIRNIDNVELINKKIEELKLGNENYIKHQLLEKLLFSNMIFNSAENEQIQILNDISIIKSLRIKNQLDLARKKWQKLFIHCIELQQPAYIEILLQEKLKLELYNNINYSYDDHKTLLKFSKQHTHSFSQIKQLRTVYQDLLFIRKRSYILAKENIESFNDNKIKFNELDKTLINSSNEFYFLYKICAGMIHMLDGNFKKAIKELSEPFEKLDINISFLKYNNEFVLDFIRFYFDVMFFAKEYKKIEALLFKIDLIAFQVDNYQEQLNIIQFLIQNRLYNTTTQYEKATNLITTKKQYFNQWIDSSSKEIKTILCASISIGNFVANNFSEALFYSQKVISIFSKSQRQEIISFFYLFEILIAYELKNSQLFESKYNNAYAHFKKYIQYKTIGLEIIHVLNKSFNKKNLKEKNEIFVEYIDTLKNNESPSLNILFTYFDIPIWIESKINKMPYQNYRKLIFKSK